MARVRVGGWISLFESLCLDYGLFEAGLRSGYVGLWF